MVKIKKSLVLLPMLMVLLLSIAPNVFGAYEKVYDEANLFSEKERAEINEQALALSEQTEMDIVIVTTNDSKGKLSSEYALDFYDEHGFGYEGTLDGVLFLINMDEREVYIFTRDKGTDYIDDSRVETLLDLVYPPLSKENYQESVQIFLEEVENMMSEGLPDSSESSLEDEYSLTEKLGIVSLISIVIGGSVVGIMAIGNKGRSTVNAHTYLQNNSFTITKKSDRHYNTIVTQQKIQRNNSSGGSFSGGGGGGGIGGGGRKF